MVIPTNLEQMNKGSYYLLPRKIFLVISVAVGGIGYRLYRLLAFKAYT